MHCRDKRMNDLRSTDSTFLRDSRGISYADNTGILYASIEDMRANYAQSFAIINIGLTRVEELLVREGPLCVNLYISEFSRRLLNYLPQSSCVYRTDFELFAILIPAADFHCCSDYLKSLDTITHHSVLVNNTSFPLELLPCALFVDSSSLSAQDLYGLSRITYLRATSEPNILVSRVSECSSEIDRLKEAYIDRDMARSSLEDGSYDVFYQPIYDLSTKTIVGFESLARLSVKGAYMPPSVFIPALRSLRMTGRLDIKILELTLRQIPFMAREAPGTRLVFSVNVSSDLFDSDDLIEQYLGTIDSYGLNAIYSYQLQIEIVEETFGDGRDCVIPFINEIRRRGHSVVIDDFGMGNSTLSRLINLQVDGLKLDKFFSDQIQADSKKGLRLLSPLVSALNDSGYSITAEGVETDKQLKWLESNGVRKVQGFYFSKPLPLKEAAELLQRWAPIPPPIKLKQKASRLSPRDMIKMFFGLGKNRK